MIDLEQDDAKGATDVLYFDGGYYPWAAMVDDWKHGRVDQAIKRDMQALPAVPVGLRRPGAGPPAGIAIDELSLYDWIETRIPGGHSSPLGQFIDVAYIDRVRRGDEAPGRDRPARAARLLRRRARGGCYGTSDERWKIVGGNQQLSLAQADYLGARTSASAGR